MGGNVETATDYTFDFLHSNACLDTRGFTTLNSGGGNPALDSNGVPTVACSLVISTAQTVAAGGPLAA